MEHHGAEWLLLHWCQSKSLTWFMPLSDAEEETDMGTIGAYGGNMFSYRVHKDAEDRAG